MTRNAPLYARLLGSSWARVAEPVRFAHAAAPAVRARGRLRISHGGNRAARLLAWALRLPRASEAADTRLVVTSRRGGERWFRTFDGRRFDSRQYQAGNSVLGERMGILDFRFQLDVSDGSLLFTQLAAAFVFGPVRVRLPAMWAPIVEAREEPAGARRTHVHVRVVMPALGPLLTYDGMMEFEETHA